MLFLSENKFYDNNLKYKFKKVHFARKINVILIPNLTEYKYFNLIDILWYSQNDFINFYKEKIIDDKLNN